MISKGIDVCFDDWENAAQWTGERGWKKEEKHKCNTNRPPLSWGLPLLFFSPKIIFFSSLAILAALFGDSFPLLVVTYFTHHVSIELYVSFDTRKKGGYCPVILVLHLFSSSFTESQMGKEINILHQTDWFFYKEIKWFVLYPMITSNPLLPLALFGDTIPLLAITYFNDNTSTESTNHFELRKKGKSPSYPWATIILLLFYISWMGKGINKLAPSSTPLL